VVGRAREGATVSSSRPSLHCKDSRTVPSSTSTAAPDRGTYATPVTHTRSGLVGNLFHVTNSPWTATKLAAAHSPAVTITFRYHVWHIFGIPTIHTDPNITSLIYKLEHRYISAGRGLERSRGVYGGCALESYYHGQAAGRGL
jgi:hypothetical protein